MIGCRLWRLAGDDWPGHTRGRGLGGGLGLFFRPLPLAEAAAGRNFRLAGARCC